jgi:hypothetical protein
MTTRREFLQAGIAASALPFGAAVTPAARNPDTAAAASPLEPAASFYKVVFDERFSESVAFAHEMARRGMTVHGISGDMTDLWYHDLHAQWQQNPVAIAGLTGHGPLFCLEQLAWDHGMRVVLRAEHRYAAENCMEHELSAPDVLLPETTSLAQAGAGWSTQMARFVSRCPLSGSRSSTRIVSPSAHRREADEDSLFTWIIAPVARSL